MFYLKKRVIPSEYDDYDEIIDEILSDKKLISAVGTNITKAKSAVHFPHDSYSWPSFLYYYIRKTKPRKIVETGCFTGVSTTYILSALEKNGNGKLYTIDKPAFEKEYTHNPYLGQDQKYFSLPKNQQPGFLVPEYLKDNWKLILGTSKEMLPPLLEKIGSIDLFLHDSLHTYKNMCFEFEIAKEHLISGGAIMADNIDWNKSFYDFSKKHNLKFYTYIAYSNSVENLRMFKRGSSQGHNFGVILT